MIKNSEMGKIKMKSQRNPIKIIFAFGFHKRRKVHALWIYGANCKNKSH
jgi:hypothetical protein